MVSLSKQIVISGYLLSFTVHGDLVRQVFLTRTHLIVCFFSSRSFRFCPYNTHSQTVSQLTEHVILKRSTFISPSHSTPYTWPPILERAILHLKLTCSGVWLKEREMLHLKLTCFAVRLIERGTLHLKRTNLRENRGLSDREEMTWGRSDWLPLKVIICLSMGLPN